MMLCVFSVVAVKLLSFVLQLWQFNLVSHTWTRIKGEGAMPEELASHSAVQRGPYMLVFGGTAMPFGDSSSDSVSRVDLLKQYEESVY